MTENYNTEQTPLIKKRQLESKQRRKKELDSIKVKRLKRMLKGYEYSSMGVCMTCHEDLYEDGKHKSGCPVKTIEKVATIIDL